MVGVRILTQDSFYFFLQIRSFTLTGTLHWSGNQTLLTGVGSNPKFYIGEPMSFVILQLKKKIK